MPRRILALVMLAALPGCPASTVMHLGADHPASPAAEEGVVPARSSVLANGHAGDRAGHGHAGRGAASVAAPVYTCPMHPEVRQSSPSSCPKCGMRLVETTGGTEGHRTHEHGHGVVQ